MKEELNERFMANKMIGTLVFFIQYFLISTVSGNLFYHNNNKLDQIYSQLPTVHILTLPNKFNSGLKSFAPHKMDSEEYSWHAQGIKFYLWLSNYYHKTVLSGNGSVLYFLPVYGQPSTPSENIWYEDLNRAIMNIAVNHSIQGFKLDKTFMSASFPVMHIQYPHPNNRNFLDIRLLRSDPEYTTNGRDIFIPYIENRHFWSAKLTSHVGTNTFFISGACRESTGTLENNRLWRTKVYKQWKDTPNTIIKIKMSSAEFDKSLVESDFCLIIPGDTSSTAKLYKSIFAGCIPVIFVSFRAQLPFSHYLDWSKFSVVVVKDVIHSKIAMKELLLHLENIRSNHAIIMEMKKNVREAASLFDYTRTTWPSVYHLTLLELTFDSTNSKHGLRECPFDRMNQRLQINSSIDILRMYSC
jgi:hypothetical protein